MASVRDRNAVTTVVRERLGAARPWCRPIILYDLISAIQDVVGPDDDQLVVATVRHLLRSAWLRSAPEGATAPRWEPRKVCA